MVANSFSMAQPTAVQARDQIGEANFATEGAQPLLQITYYTDPLCSWSWAFEPQWRRLRYEFGTQLQWRYCMGGMIADWQQYSDPLNDVSRPVQMGPQWYQVRTLSGMPFDEHIWYEDPPASSYPAGIAVKAAEQQGTAAGEHYLRRLREAVMVERCNIARQKILLALAIELADQGLLDAGRFAEDLENAVVIDAFREDLKEVRWREIGRFPTLILRSNGNDTAAGDKIDDAKDSQAIVIVGYRPYKVLLDAVKHVNPTLQRQRTAADLLAYAAYWRSLTTREAAEILDGDLPAAEQQLQAAAKTGALRHRRTSRSPQAFWDALAAQ